MLPADNRLRKTKEIERVWKGGRSFFTPMMQIKGVRNGLPVSRFTVVVGTKAEKSAVKRNTWRRRVRDILRSNLAAIAPGFDIVVYAKKDGISADFKDIEKTLTEALKSAGVLTKR
jgi:ribonuclease P protein component